MKVAPKWLEKNGNRRGVLGEKAKKEVRQTPLSFH